MCAAGHDVSAGSLLAQPQDLLVLRGKTGERQPPESGELVDPRFQRRDASDLVLYLVLEPMDLSLARIGDLSRVAPRGESPFELVGHMLVRAGAIAVRVRPPPRRPGS